MAANSQFTPEDLSIVLVEKDFSLVSTAFDNKLIRSIVYSDAVIFPTNQNGKIFVTLYVQDVNDINITSINDLKIIYQTFRNESDVFEIIFNGLNLIKVKLKNDLFIDSISQKHLVEYEIEYNSLTINAINNNGGTI